MTSLQNYLKETPVITTKIADKIGVNRQQLSLLVKEGKLERIRPGVYQKKGELIDNLKVVVANSEKIIFSHQTALYLHDLCDRIPSYYYISVPQGYNTLHLKKRHKNLRVKYVKKELFTLGLTEITTSFGSIIPVYNLERTICDIIINRNNIDRQVYIDGITRYFKRKEKNIEQLIKYSYLFNIENEVKQYLEVLL